MKNKIAIIIFALFVANLAHAQSVAGWIVSGTGSFVHPVPVADYSNPAFVSGSTRPSSSQVAIAVARTYRTRFVWKSYRDTLAAGVTATSGSLALTLPASVNDQSNFLQLLQTYNTATMPATATIPTTSGSAATVTVAQLYSLVGSYEAQIAALNSALSQAKATILFSGTATIPNITLTDVTGT